MLEDCAKKFSNSESQKFIENGIKLGLDTEYKITIKRCNNKDGFSVSMSCNHRSKTLTLRNVSGLPLQ